jgi:hypothetical protein
MLSVAAGVVAAVYLIRLKWHHLLACLIFAAGGICSAFFVYLFFYSLLQGTSAVFVPSVIAFIVWVYACLRLFAQNRSFQQVSAR